MGVERKVNGGDSESPKTERHRFVRLGEGAREVLAAIRDAVANDNVIPDIKASLRSKFKNAHDHFDSKAHLYFPALCLSASACISASGAESGNLFQAAAGAAAAASHVYSLSTNVELGRKWLFEKPKSIIVSKVFNKAASKLEGIEKMDVSMAALVLAGICYGGSGFTEVSSDNFSGALPQWGMAATVGGAGLARIFERHIKQISFKDIKASSILAYGVPIPVAINTMLSSYQAGEINGLLTMSTAAFSLGVYAFHLMGKKNMVSPGVISTDPHTPVPAPGE